MKTKKVLFLAMLLLAIILLPCTANAAVGETFKNDGVEYKVLTETGNTGTVQIIDYDNNKAQLTIPEIITYDSKQYTVVDIANNAFSGCNALTNIGLPDSIVKIGEYSFEDCISLETINIPNNISEIGGAAFWGCKNLTNDIIIPSSIKKIEGYTFWGCEKLENINFENGVEYIGVYAFGQNAIQKIILPETITYIDDIAFGYCDNLKELIVPNSTAVFYDVITPDLKENLTIYGFTNSTAQEYANTNNHKFVELYSITNKLTNISSDGKLYIIPKLDDYEVILTPNKGYRLPESISIKIGEYNLPIDDYKYNSETGSLKITADKIVGDIEIEGFGEKICKITFDPNEGEFFSGKKVIVYEDAKYFEYDKLEQPSRSGYKFLGYYNEDEKSLDDIMNSEAGIDEDMIFYAKWEKLQPIESNEEDEKQEIEVEKTGADKEKNEIDNKKDNPATGDNIGIYITILVVSVLGIGVIILIKNKRQKRSN